MVRCQLQLLNVVERGRSRCFCMLYFQNMLSASGALPLQTPPGSAPGLRPLPDSLVILSTLLVCQPVHGKNPAGVHAVIRIPGKVFAHILPERIEPLLRSKEDRSSLDSHQDVQQWMPSNWHYTTTTTRRFRRFDGSIRLRGQTLPVERRLTHRYHI